MSDDAPITSAAPGRVYFVQAGEHGPIKIGWTAGNPLARMAALQTGNAEPLRLLAWAPGSQQDERALHERFASLRMLGEWFRPEAGLLAFVGGVAWASRGAPTPAAVQRLPCGLSASDLEDIALYCDARRVREAMLDSWPEVDPPTGPLSPERFGYLLGLVCEAESLTGNESTAIDLFGRDEFADQAAKMYRLLHEGRP